MLDSTERAGTSGAALQRGAGSRRAPRRWWRPHLSTVIIVLPCVAILTLSNIGGRDQDVVPSQTSWEHGWPWTFLERVAGPPDLAIRFKSSDRWRLWHGYHSVRWPALAADAVACAGIVLLFGVCLESRRRRRRRRIQFTLFDLLLAIAGCAALAAYAASMREDERRTIECLKILSPQTHIRFEPALPDWCCDLLGKERLIAIGWRRVALPHSIDVGQRGPCAYYSPLLLDRGKVEQEFAALRYLHDRHATELRLAVGVGLTDDALLRLRSLDRLQSLAVSHNALSPSLLDAFPELRTLIITRQDNFDGAPPPPETLSKIGRLRKLEKLTIRGTLLDEHLAPLAALTKLKVLDLDGPRDRLGLADPAEVPIDDGRFAPLSKLRSLRALEMTHLSMPGNDLAFVEPLEHLEKLTLHNVVLRGRCLRHLARMRHLHVLHLESRGLDDSSVNSLPALPELNDLVLGGQGITGASLSHLNELRDLVGVRLDGTSIRTLDPLNLDRWPYLKSLGVSAVEGLEIDAGAATRLQRMRPGLRVGYGHSPSPPKLPAPLEPGGQFNPRNWFRGRTTPAAKYSDARENRGEAAKPK